MRRCFIAMVAAGMALCTAVADDKSSSHPNSNDGDKATFGAWGIETEHISSSIKPGDDFFKYVNEGWIKTTKIPSGYWDYGQSSILASETQTRIRDTVLNAVEINANKGTVAQQTGDLYRSFIDVERIEQLGLTSIQNELNSIVKSDSYEAIARWMADPRSSSIVAINVFPDAGNTRRWLVHLDQLNLNQPIFSLPRPEYYNREDGAFPQDRAAYVDYITKLFEAVGIDRGAQRAADILALETKLAALQWDFEKLRDRRSNYHLMTIGELNTYAPGFPWAEFLSARGVGDVQEIVLGTDTAVQAQIKVFSETPIDHWASYLAFHWIQNQIELLPSALRNLSFEFHGKRLSGQKEPEQRKDRAVGFVSSKAPQLVGKLYAQRYFPEDHRRSASELFDYMRRAFTESLESAEWMDNATRSEAQAKLSALKIKVGYPTIWRDYSEVEIRKDDVLGNAYRLLQADWRYARSFLKSVGDKEAWFQSPQTVDASYSVLMNAVELPSAFLQPPYFDPQADHAVNFGAVAAIIGHEMGHAFDDQGALFDGSGRLRNWWTESSRKQFKERTDALIGQYASFSPIEGLYLNGRSTLGENIGDLTGVSVAHRAYQIYLRDHPEEIGLERDGFTNDQRFFLSWAQVWRYLAPDSAIRHLVAYGYHAPAPYRVNGVVRNMDAWYEAFDVKPGQKLYLPPTDRIRLW